MVLSLRLSLKDGSRLPKHRFTNGDSAVLSRMNERWSTSLSSNEIDDMKCDGVIFSVDAYSVTLMVDPPNFERFEFRNKKIMIL